MNGNAGIYEKSSRDRVDVTSATRTSTNRIIEVYPILIFRSAAVLSLVIKAKYLVKHGTDTELVQAVRRCLDDRTYSIKTNRQQDELHSPKDICNFSRGRLLQLAWEDRKIKAEGLVYLSSSSNYRT
jgi:hypothetical protein